MAQKRRGKSSDEGTKVDEIIRRVKRHPVLAWVVVLFVAIAALDPVLSVFDRVRTYFAEPEQAAASQARQSVQPTTSARTSVSGTTGWQDTGIDVSAGDEIQVAASGTVRFDSSGRSATPNGSGGQRAMSSPCNYLLCGPDIPAHALVGRIGSPALSDATSGFFVGSDYSSALRTGGRLYLGFNDGFVTQDRHALDVGGVADNAGAFDVVITVTRHKM